MNRKIVSLCLLAVLCLTFCVSAPAEEAAEPFHFNGARWGMSQKQIRWLMGTPTQEPTGLGGYTTLVYQTKLDELSCIIQYSFMPDGSLYLIEATSEDGEEFYNLLAEQFTEQFGKPLQGEGEEAEAAEEGGTLVWQPDEETMIVLALNWSSDTCYAQMQRITSGK